MINTVGTCIAAKANLDMVKMTADGNKSVITASIKLGGSTYITVVAVYGPQETEKE